MNLSATPSTPPRRALVIPPVELAALIRSLGAVEALAASGRPLLVLAPPQTVPLVGLLRTEAEVLPRPDDLAAERVLAASAAPAEAVVLDRRLRDAWIARTAGLAPCRGYGSVLGRVLLHRTVRAPRRANGDHSRLLAAMGVDAPAVPALAIGEELRELAAERLERARITTDRRPLLGVYAGVEGGAGNPWPRVRFEELLRELRRRRPSSAAIVLATAGDLWRAVRIYETTGKIHPVIGPDLGLDSLAALLAELDLLVAADSWLLALAAAVGTPTVGLYVRDPRHWSPLGREHRALRARGGSLGSILLEDVLEAVGWD